jgi:methylmalonyl-CoA mutase N-terminal domain/subunit
VGVNCFQDEGEKPPEMKFFRIGRPMIEDRIRYIRDYRKARDARAVGGALDAVAAAARAGANVMPSVFAAVRAKCTLGEIGEAFRKGIGHSLSV